MKKNIFFCPFAFLYNLVLITHDATKSVNPSDVCINFMCYDTSMASCDKGSTATMISLQARLVEGTGHSPSSYTFYRQFPLGTS